MKRLFKNLIGKIIQFLFGKFKIVSNKIFLETGTGEAKDQVRAVYDYITANHPGEYIFIWALDKGASKAGLKDEEIVLKKTLKYYFHLLTSKYWLRTHSIQTIVSKRNGQVYIQLWHGPGAIKKEGYDIKGIHNDGKVMPHAREWDYYIATDIDNQKYIKTALNLKIPTILLGSCRTDALVNNRLNDCNTLRRKFNLSKYDKVILYAPTFREENFQSEKITLNIEKLLKMKNIKLILRLHPEVKERFNFDEYKGNVVDGNVFEDIFELYLVSDILVTDYSSVAIEFSILRKPILYYMYDLDDYINERDFYYDYLDNLSGPILRNEEELIKAIGNIDFIMEQYYNEYKVYSEKYNNLNDGKVCSRFYRLLREGEFTPII